jgi:single-stranded-DNA-specific exonuclease
MDRKPARWLIPDVPAAESQRLAAEAGIGSVTARVLWKRDIRTADAARRFLHPRIEDLHDPFDLADMDKAASRLIQAIRKQERILLYGDYDVDGTSSIVILHTALRLAGGQVEYHVPHRIREGYGMREEVIQEAAARGIGLIVSVDTGIRANAVVEHARVLGIDVIVTDHHLPEAALPRAVAVLNPNRPDCRYPAKNLCGAAVAWKLAQALLTRLDWPEARRVNLLHSLLKLVAIATVADVVPLTGENRIIVWHGLRGLSDPRNPGLRELLRVAGVKEGECPTARQVAFQVAPRLNAAGRMDDAANVIQLFLNTDPVSAGKMAATLDELNKQRRQTEDEIKEQILAECERQPVTDTQAGLVFSAPGWHQGVIGIVAGRLVERYCRPVFVISEDAETGQAHGSGRSPAIFHLLEAMETMPDLFLRFGGHRQAAGLKMACDRIAEFRTRFERFAATLLTPEDLCPVHDCDAAMTLEELNDSTARELLALAPFGAGNPPPLLALRKAQIVRDPQVKNEKHLFLHLRHNGMARIAKGWHLAEIADEFEAGAYVDAAVMLEEDKWEKAASFWGLVLKDARRCQMASNSSSSLC